MNRSSVLSRSVISIVFSLWIAANLMAAQPAKEYQPQVGQEGKDVIWVPTPQALVDKMLDIAKVTPKDYVIDLGSGDGRTVITAAKRGVKALGIEYNPDMVELSKRNAAKEGVSNRASFTKADLFESDFSQATVITMFLLPDINIKLRPKILNLKPGTRIVSNSFTMGDWTADETVSVKDSCASYCTAAFARNHATRPNTTPRARCPTTPEATAARSVPSSIGRSFSANFRVTPR